MNKVYLLSFYSGEFSFRSELLNLVLIQFSQTIWKEDFGLNLFYISMKK